MTKVLVIEDEKFIQETIMDILELNDYDVECADNGKIGLEKAKNNTPDLVLCDVMMPEMDGLQTVEAFKKIPELNEIPFVFLSALSEMSDFRKGMNLGASDYLTKPFAPKDLLHVIAQQISNKKSSEEKSKKISDEKVKEALGELKIQVKEKNKGFHDSMQHAKTIQSTILPSDDYMVKMFPNLFVIYHPKDIVTGDFYWVKKLNNIKIIAAADCTGHGIPAALLSMTCYHMLNMAIDQYGLRTPAEILTKVNELINQFMSENNPSFITEGMDIAICSIDNDINHIRYAGAQRPLYIVTDELKPLKVNMDNVKILNDENGNSLYDIKGSVCAIGGSNPNFKFEDQIIEFKEGDMFYIGSDGFADQFGGEKDKKFQTKNLKRLLLANHKEKVKGQKEILEKVFEDWKGNQEQTDDVTLLGIKI